MRRWVNEVFKQAPPAKCIFRVDAGNRPGLAFGHLSRCMIFANILQELYSTECFFMMKDIPEGVTHAEKFRCSVFRLPEHISSDMETNKIDDLSQRIKPDCLILDLPYRNIDPAVFSLLKRKGVQTIFIDDFRFFNPGADIVFNSSILAREKFSEQEKGALFLGPDYFIFDDAMIGQTTPFLRHKTNIVISFGGADPTRLTRDAVQFLAGKNHRENRVFHIVLGPGYAETTTIKNIVKNRPKTFKIIENPDNIIPYFMAADFVICAGGRTMYELYYLSKPFLPIATSDVEAEAVQAFIKNGLVETGLEKWDVTKFELMFNQAKLRHDL